MGRAALGDERKAIVFNEADNGGRRARQECMILLITPSAKIQECAQALQEATSEATEVASTLRQAAAQLRAHEFSAVVVDQSLVESEPDESDLVLQHMGGAIPVYINFAISNLERVVRELRAALHRRKREVLAARRTAEEALCSELKGTVTALLLSCEMALQASDFPAAEGKIRKACELAKEVRAKLGAAESS